MAGSLHFCHSADVAMTPPAAKGAEMSTMIKNFIVDDSGADLIEYALLAGLVALAAVTTLTAVGTNIAGLYTKISTKVSAIVVP
jgi:pilus assembly protein Flp/PilA